MTKPPLMRIRGILIAVAVAALLMVALRWVLATAGHWGESPAFPIVWLAFLILVYCGPAIVRIIERRQRRERRGSDADS